jgi:hypothetical protein
MNEKKLTLPIVIGRRYVRRDGVVVTAQERFPTIGRSYCYIGEGPVRARRELHVFINTGRVSINCNVAFDYASDLVADYVDAPAVPDGFTPWRGGKQPAEDADGKAFRTAARLEGGGA